MDQVEIWVPAWRAPGYEVSSEGRVARILKTTGRRKILKPLISRIDRHRNHRYSYIYTYGEGKRRNVRLHRLVWSSFNRRDVPPGMVIHHRNNNGFDNRIENLECTTYAENTRVKLYDHTGGNKLTADDAAVIKALRFHLADVISARELADLFGLHNSTVHGIAGGRQWPLLPVDGCVDFDPANYQIDD